MSFQHPFQAIQQLSPQEPGGRNVLVAAAGPEIYTFDVENGRQLSVWPESLEPQKSEPIDTSPGGEVDSEIQGPPEKKRKLSPSADDSKTVFNGKGSGGKKKSAKEWTIIPILTTSADGKHLIALTGEDKCIRVFDANKDGKLTQLSARCMPKRPCTIIVTPDNSAILCGDKFGDVYELPLHPAEEVILPERKHQEPPKPYQPQATKLTVHTKRNLQALEQQLKSSVTPSGGSTPSFKHKLLLGHVSLLTDVVFAAIPAEKSPSGKPRNYVLTSDRDEHIRVSRGPPQAHIIEHFCLGHTSFVSKLCIPPSRPDILISGGGDRFLFVWDWLQGKVLQQVQLGPTLDSQDLAVHGIWTTPLNLEATAVIVACEGVPSLFCFTFGIDGVLTSCPPIEVAGNVLSVKCLRDGIIIVSVDNVHEPSSTKAPRSTPTSPQILLQAFKLSSGSEGLRSEPALGSILDTINGQGSFDAIVSNEDESSKGKKLKALSDSLYAIGNLRKRRPGDE